MHTPQRPIRHFQHQPNHGRDWKDHPLVVAVIAAASTAVFFMTVVLPLRVDLLTSKVERLTATAAEAMATAEKLEKTEKELADARAAQLLATTNTPFAGRSIYPIGFDQVVIGTPVDLVVKRYSHGKWDDDYSYYSITNAESGVVTGATYYFDGKGDKRTVKFILYHLKSPGLTFSQLVHRHFLATFGEPLVGRRNKMLWKATDKEWVTLETFIAPTYHVYPAGHSMALADIDDSKKK